MFKAGDLIQRKYEYFDELWIGDFCRQAGIPPSGIFTVLRHSPEEETVEFTYGGGIECGVYDYKMELVNTSLENK